MILFNANSIGFQPYIPSGVTSTLALSASTTWIAFSFVAKTTTTVSGFRCYCSAVTSPAATDAVATLFSDLAGVPNVSLTGTSNTTTPATPAVGELAWSSFTGTLNVTAGTRYWIVVTNANAVQASHNFTIRYGTSSTGDAFGEGTGRFWGPTVASWNGSTWSSLGVPAAGWRVDFADGTYYDLASQNIALTGSTAPVCFGANEFGTVFTAPANCPLNVMAIRFFLGLVNGSPVGPLQYVLRQYNGSTLENTWNTYSIPVANIGGAAWYTLYLSGGTVSLVPGRKYRVTMQGQSADSSANYFRSYVYTIDGDAASQAQLLYGMQQTTSSNAGVGNPTPTWADTATAVFPFGLVLDNSGGEFASTFIAPAATMVRGITQY